MEFRIEELAERAAISTRNIRAYQARGLLPPPTIRGRVGYYGEEHLRRLQLIHELQVRGFALEGIRQLLDAWSRGADINDLLGFHKIITDPWSDEPIVVVSEADLMAMFPETASDPSLIEEAIALDLMSRQADGSLAGPQIMIQVGVRLLAIGLTLPEIFELVRQLRSDAGGMARHLLDVVSTQLLVPMATGSIDAARLHELLENVIDLRGLTMDVIRPILAHELDAALDEALELFRQRLEGTLDPRADGDTDGVVFAAD